MFSLYNLLINILGDIDIDLPNVPNATCIPIPVGHLVQDTKMGMHLPDIPFTSFWIDLKSLNRSIFSSQDLLLLSLPL